MAKHKKKIKMGDIVYLKTDLEQRPRIVIKYEVSPGGIYYQLGCVEVQSWHYEIEFTDTKEYFTNKVGFN